MIALQIPDDADGPEVIVAAQMQDFLRDCLRRPVRMVVRNRSLNCPGFTGGQNSRRIARYGTCTKEEDREAVFT